MHKLKSYKKLCLFLNGQVCIQTNFINIIIWIYINSPKTRNILGISLKQISSFLLLTVKYEEREKWIIEKPSWIPSQNPSHRLK